MKKYDKLAKSIISLVGGKKNIDSLTHCVTRLRFVLKDSSITKDEEIKNLSDVITVVEGGGQYQIVVGTKVDDVYDAIIEEMGGKLSTSTDDTKGMTLFEKAVDVISKLFQPILGVLCAAGMLKGFNALFSILGLYSDTSGTYIMINAFGDAMFMFLPIILGYTSAKKFGLHPFVGLTIGAILCYPTIQLSTLQVGTEPIFTIFANTAYEMNSYIDLFGLPVIAMDYTSSVIPVIVVVYFASKVQKFLNSFIPDVLKFAFIPMLTILISMIFAFMIIGPTVTVLTSLLTDLMQKLFNFSSTIYGFVYGITTLTVIIFGLHWGLIALWVSNILTVGYDNLAVIAIVNTFTAFAAMVAIYLKSKNEKTKQVAASSMISAFCGITEPSLYGILLPLKKPFIYCSIANGIAGAIMGATHVKEYIIGGWGIFEFPSFINPTNGDMSSMYWTIVAVCVGMVIAFVLNYFFFDEEESGNSNKNDNKQIETSDKKEVLISPMKGEIISLEEVADSAFSSGALGDGIAIIPDEGSVYSPIDGKVTTLFPSNHAIGITGKDEEEILIHVGLNTCELKGKHFYPQVQQGDEVKKGQLLMKFDLEDIKAAGYDMTSPVTVTNSKSFLDVVKTDKKEITVFDDLFIIIF